MTEINIELPFLLSDTGSSNGRWIVFSKDGSIRSFSTAGFSPNFSDPKIIEDIALQVQRETKGKIKDIHFFGTGCFHEDPASKVQQSLKTFFPDSEILVRSDLEAAALATLGNRAGWAGILGTGSSLGYWDGEKLKLVKPQEAFGHWDPGSGTHLGRQLLLRLSEGRLSHGLANKLLHEFPDIPKRIETLYSLKGPDKNIAAVGGWMIENADDYDELSILINEAFHIFCENYLTHNGVEQGTEIQFNGSIASHGKIWLQHQLSLYGYKLGKVIDSPLDGLINYYKEKIHDKRY